MNRRNDLVRLYFNLGLNHLEILSFLTLRHNYSLSLRQLKRILRNLGLYRKKHFSSIELVSQFIEEEIEKSGRLHGYRWMHLKCIHRGYIVTQETVRILLSVLDPVGTSLRRRKRLRRRDYFNKGHNFLWHVDGYDKLKPYGIAISGCIDGFSRNIVWLNVGYTNNDPKVISGFFITAVETLKGCPRCIRTDFGTENRYIEQMQMLMRNKLENDAMPAFIYGSSTHNQRIEAWWGILRKHSAQFWMNLFENLKDQNLFTGNWFDKALMQVCFVQLIQEELDNVVLEWNMHKISSSRNRRAPVGKPFVMYNNPELYDTHDYKVQVSDEEVLACKEECKFLTCPSRDKDVYELAQVIIEENNLQLPSTPDEGVEFYINLRQQMLAML